MVDDLVIRQGSREDCKQIFRLIQGLAEYEKVTEPLEIDEKSLERDGFDTQPPLYKCLVVEDPEQGKQREPRKLIGCALYHWGYSTHFGKKCYLEDLFIDKEYRKKGIGRALFQKLCQIAVQDNCKVLNFTVVNWNPSKEFYKKFGPEDFTDTKGWHFHSLNEEDMCKAAGIVKKK